MRLRWSSPYVVTVLVTNLLFLLVGCGAQSISSTGRRTPPPMPTATPAPVETVNPAEDPPEETAEPDSSDGSDGSASPDNSDPAPAQSDETPELLGFVDQPGIPMATVLAPDAVAEPFVVTNGRVDPTDIPINRLAAPSDATLRVGVSGVELLGLHPAQAQTLSELMVADMLHDGLTATVVAAGSDPIVIGELADSWGTVTDASEWKFMLRAGTFHDDTPVTASMVKSSFSAVVSQYPESLAARHLAPIEGWEAVANGSAATLSGIEVVDDTTVRFNLDEEVADFDLVLSDVGLGIVDPEDLANGSSLWNHAGVLQSRLSLVHTIYDNLEFDRIDLVAYPDEIELVDAFAVGALDLALLGDGRDSQVLTKSDVAGIDTRPDGSFDVLNVTRNQG